MLRNTVISAKGEILPWCQDTGTAIVIGKKGENVWTGVNDAEYLSKGIFETFKEKNLRYSQVVPFPCSTKKTRAPIFLPRFDIYSNQGESYEYRKFFSLNVSNMPFEKILSIIHSCSIRFHLLANNYSCSRILAPRKILLCRYDCVA